MKATGLSVLITLIACISGHAQTGNSAYTFLNLPVSSHANALGGNNISIIEDDVTLIDQNPALLGPEMDLQLALNYMKYVADINIAGLTFAKSVGSYGALGFSLQYIDYGKFTQTESDGTVTGSFGAKDIAFNILYGHDFADRLRGGITAKMIYSSYEQYTALALGIDLGLNYYNPDKEFSASLLFKNLGGQLKKYNNTQEGMPWDIQLGISKTLEHAPFRISVTAWHLNKWDLSYPAVQDNANLSEETIADKSGFFSDLFRHLIFGIDFIPTRNVYVAIGYNYKTKTDMKTFGRSFLSGFSAGAGIRVKMFGIGASLAQHHTSGTSFMFNITTNLADFIR